MGKRQREMGKTESRENKREGMGGEGEEKGRRKGERKRGERETESGCDKSVTVLCSMVVMATLSSR